VPDDVCNLRNQDRLIVFKADCTSDDNEVVCGCCTNCEKSSSVSLDNRELAVMAKLKLLSGSKLFETDSPQQLAANWIVKEDGLMLTASSQNLYQRYVLAVLFFMMGDEKWFSLGSNTSECIWERIGCDANGSVNHIKFDHCDMHGPIPSEIKVLTELNYLDLSENKLDGVLPGELASLDQLSKLFLEGNDIVGAVPFGLCMRHSEGLLLGFTSDCAKVQCTCCNNCMAGSNTTPSDGNNVAGADTTRQQQIKQKCNDLSNGASDIMLTPQSLAMQWIRDDDQLQLNVDSPHFNQRFVVVVIYFSLGGDSWIDAFWLNPVAQGECVIPGITCNSSNRITKLDFCK